MMPEGPGPQGSEAAAPAPGGAAGHGPMAACPHLDGFDPLLPEQVFDPGFWTARARSECPVFYMPKYGEWVVTRFEDCLAVLNDNKTFSSAHSLAGSPPSELTGELPFGYAFRHSMGNFDPPEHDRLRKISRRFLSHSKARGMEEQIRALCHATIDEFADSGQADLILAFGRKIPIRVITTLLKLPEQDAPRLYQWALDLLQLFGDPLMPAEARTRLALGQAEFHQYLQAAMAERERSPLGDDDFMTSLLQARPAGGADADAGSRGSQLSDLEVLGTIATMIFGGADTSATLIAHLVHSLLSDRSNWEELLENRELIEATVEESMRQRSPARGPRRWTTSEVTIAGVTIPAGQQVWAGIWSANHDEGTFPDADKFDMHRPNIGKHLGWGHGIHYCIGTPLARAEARIAIDCLLDRLPSLRLVPGHQLEYQNSNVIPTLLGGLVVEWDVPADQASSG
jgi:cytochrome P450